MRVDHLNLLLVLMTTALAIGATLDAARRAPWQAPAREQWIWAIATLAVLAGHRASFALPQGGELHYLGAAWLTLLVGYPRAVLSMAAVQLVQMAWQDAPAQTWGLRVLIGAVLPVWTMWGVVQACRRWLPRNLFVFLLGCGLLGIAAVNMLQFATGTAAMALLGTQTARVLWDEFLPYGLLLSWGEAWIEGMVITLAVVYAPTGTVRLFDEAWYLAKPST